MTPPHVQSLRSTTRCDGSLRVIHDGITRTVVLVGPLAIKLPTLRYGWGNFLRALLANLQERTFARLGHPRLCPVLFSVPGGWLVVMRRARPLTDGEWTALQPRVGTVFRDLPVEHKHDSFGVLDDRFVAVDYGN